MLRPIIFTKTIFLLLTEYSYFDSNSFIVVSEDDFNQVEMHEPVLVLYSVMQSDGNSISGDVVLDSFNVAYLDEFNISDHNIKKQIRSDNFQDDFNSL